MQKCGTLTGTATCTLRSRCSSSRTSSSSGRRRNHGISSASSSSLAPATMIGLVSLRKLRLFRLSLCMGIIHYAHSRLSSERVVLLDLNTNSDLVLMVAHAASSARTFEDFYRVVVLSDRSQEFSGIIATLKQEFVDFPKTIVCNSPATMFCSSPICAVPMFRCFADTMS